MEAILRKVQDRIQQGLKRNGGGAKYFSNTRRGESAELQADLNSADLSKQKGAVKRIIANMTLGRDVSSLFVDVVKLGQTSNLELKKLVYLYVLNTAKLQPDKALMAVNTFLQDASSPSPIVRALAVRTMMCIRVSSVIEYTLEPLRRAVVDTNPYVRKTAAIGLGKLFYNNMEYFYEQDLTVEVIKLLNDNNATVASNAAAIVGEINDYGTTPLDTVMEWMNRLLLHLSEASEWGQVYILDLLASARPKSTDAAEAIVSRVIPRLGHTNPAVVMGAIKVIANLANRCAPQSIERYSVRINAALLSLAKTDPETQYVVCKNIHALLVVFPNLLRSSLDAFFVRFNDPPYVKLEKLHLLLKLVTPSTAILIVKELTEYSTEVDLLFVEKVVKAIATLAIKVEAVSGDCAQLLMRLVERRPELLPHVITAAKNIVRKYPDLLLLEPLINEFGADAVVGEEAKASLIWMLGEYHDFIENGHVVLQQFIDTIMSQEEIVQLAIITAVVKMFLRNPEEMQPTLNQVLETITQRSVDPDVRDRAFAYWRLLSRGIAVDTIRSIVHGQRAPINVDRTFSDAMTMADLKKSINSAAAVFAKPYQSFLPPYGLADSPSDEEDEEDGEGPSTPPMGPQEVTTTAAAAAASKALKAPATMPTAPKENPVEDLFTAAPPSHVAEQTVAPSHPSTATPATTTAPATRGTTANVLDDLFS